MGLKTPSTTHPHSDIVMLAKAPHTHHIRDFLRAGPLVGDVATAIEGRLRKIGAKPGANARVAIRTGDEHLTQRLVRVLWVGAMRSVPAAASRGRVDRLRFECEDEGIEANRRCTPTFLVELVPLDLCKHFVKIRRGPCIVIVSSR